VTLWTFCPPAPRINDHTHSSGSGLPRARAALLPAVRAAGVAGPAYQPQTTTTVLRQEVAP
jgi:hypothetical protein